MLTANSTPTQAPLKVLAPGFTVFLISQSTTTPSAINTITIRLAFSAPISGAAGDAAIVVSLPEPWMCFFPLFLRTQTPTPKL